VARPSRPFIALLLLSSALLLYVAFPFRTPLFLALVITAVLHDTHGAAHRRARGQATNRQRAGHRSPSWS